MTSDCATTSLRAEGFMICSLRGQSTMIEVHIPEPLEGTESKRMVLKVIKAKDQIEVETSAFPIEVYDEALALGFAVLLNRGQSKITGTSIPDDDERAAASAEAAVKTLADMYA